MGLTLLVVLISLPILEIAVLIEAGSAIGLWTTICGIILTGVIGAFLFRTQGLRVMHDLQATLHAGETPIQTMLDGAGLLIAGTLLFLPGFLTDVIGLVLFMPTVRVMIMALLVRRLLSHQRGAQAAAYENQTNGPRPSIIDGEFTEIKKSSKNDEKET